MANSTQSSKPTEFMPRIRDALAASLELDTHQVKIATDESGGVKSHWVGEDNILLVLKDPGVPNPLAGAGRRGVPLTRLLYVKVRTRGGEDTAGEDEIALANHWDFQDRVINALLILPHTEDKDGAVPLIEPIKFVGEGSGDVKRIESSTAGYESVLVFQLKYIAQVEVETS